MEQNRRVQYFAALAVSLAILVNSMVNFWSTPALIKFTNNEVIPNMTHGEISWIVAVAAPGMVAGSMTASSISDNFGRRTSLITSALPYIVGTVMILWAQKVWILYSGRVLWGIGSGMVSTVSNVYISEIADKDIRGTLTAGTRFMFSVGALIMLSAGNFVSYYVLSSFVIICPVGYLIACCLMPETPYFLIKQGKTDAAKKELFKLSGSKDEEMIQEKLRLMQSTVVKEMERSGSIKELFTGKQYRRAVIISAGLRFTQIMTGVIPIQTYLGNILEQSNCGINISAAFIIYGAARFVIGLVSPLTVDKFGRRPLLIYTYAASAVILFTIAVYFWIQQMPNMNNESSHPYGYIVYIGIVLYIIIANIGFDVLVFIIPSEIFPINVKSIAMAVLSVFSAFIIFVSIKGHQIIDDNFGLYTVFCFYAIMALSGAIFSYFIIPETRGKSLREIQILLQGNIYDETNEVVNKMIADVEDVEQNEETKSLNPKENS